LLDGQPTDLFIDGEFVPAARGGTLAVEDPATGTVLIEVSAATADDVDRAVAAARRALAGTWATLTPAARGLLLHRLADLIERDLESLAAVESLDNGKPGWLTAAVDLPLTIDIVRYMSGWPTKLLGATIPLSQPDASYHAYTRLEPIGVVAAIVPWNFPLLIAAWKLAPALAAGCTVVLKPAEQTPLTALRLARLVDEAGFPPGVINVLTGDGPSVGAPLAAHLDVDKVAFTGSGEVGRAILDAARGNLKKVSLELGGKSADIIFADADLDAAVDGAALAIFANSGQGCSAGSRLLVQQDVYDDVLARVAAKAASLRVAPGAEADSFVGPLVSREQLDRVAGLVAQGRRDGARVVTGGEPLGGDGYFFPPTVLADAPTDSVVVTEEIFGPVVVTIPFADEDDAVRIANSTSYGLAAGIWTSSISVAHRVAARLKAGTVWVNTYNVYDSALPFGGFKQSGWGRDMGREAVDQYLETKSVAIRIG
jgi:phenylacetaldehyde dehydrogenase